MAAVLRLADDQGRRRPADRVCLPERLPVVPGLDDPPDRVAARLTPVRVSLSDFRLLNDIIVFLDGRVLVTPSLVFLFNSNLSYFFIRFHIFRSYRISFSVI